MKRVICLYRVSTKGQVDKDDIPMQRIECARFAESKGWTIVNEYSEKGVSGLKVSAYKRDAIMEIRNEAERGTFDVLLVYMFDRLGRRDDETPFLVEWFDKQGIEIWSCQEGQQTFSSHVDKLLNYIRYWQANGESLKTSMRIKTKHQQMVEQGVWRGGAKPYGYKLVHNGRLGKKNRQLYDLAIDEVESVIVREVFFTFCHQGMGIHRLANYLNQKYPSPNKVWAPQTVRSLLKNPIYTGRMKFNDIKSPIIDELRIISDSEYEFTQRVMKGRVTRKETIPKGEEKTESMASIYGATMLSGILYCGHCDHKLVGSYHAKERKNGRYYRPIYRCYNGGTVAKGCTGQRTYSALKVESAVLETVRSYFSHFSKAVDDVWKEQASLQLKQTSQKRLKQAQGALSKLNAQYKKLRDEMLKVMMGESVFDEATIKEMLDEKKEAIRMAEVTLQEVEQSMADSNQRLKALIDQYNQISDWAEVFDDATNDEKKMILARMIKKVTVDKKYEIHIHFKITLASFIEQVTSPEGVVIIDELAEKVS